MSSAKGSECPAFTAMSRHVCSFFSSGPFEVIENTVFRSSAAAACTVSGVPAISKANRLDPLAYAATICPSPLAGMTATEVEVEELKGTSATAVDVDEVEVDPCEKLAAAGGAPPGSALAKPSCKGRTVRVAGLSTGIWSVLENFVCLGGIQCVD